MQSTTNDLWQQPPTNTPTVTQSKTELISRIDIKQTLYSFFIVETFAFGFDVELRELWVFVVDVGFC
jgi:hypothetical protein